MEEKRHDCCSEENTINMDIIVTTPKSEIKNIKKEVDDVKKDGGMFFRALRHRPQVEETERIYFVQNGLLRGFGIIQRIEKKSSQECASTGRTWKGGHFIFYNDWHWLKTPIRMIGFQGFRYAKKLGIKGDEECYQQ